METLTQTAEASAQQIDSVSITKLNKTYGHWCDIVLTSNGYIKASPKERNKPQRFAIMKH